MISDEETPTGDEDTENSSDVITTTNGTGTSEHPKLSQQSSLDKLGSETR